MEIPWLIYDDIKVALNYGWLVYHDAKLYDRCGHVVCQILREFYEWDKNEFAVLIVP